MSANDKAASAWDDYVSQQQEEKIEELELELNAANKRLEEIEKSGVYDGRPIDMALLDKESGDAALTYSIGLDLQKENNSLKDRIKRLEDALTSIGEYWNRDTNERAMEDACWYAVNTAADALEAKEDKP